MNYEEFEAHRGKLVENRLEAEGLLQDARYTYGVVKERHDELTTQRAGAVTEQDRQTLDPQVAESAEKLKNLSQQVRDREAGVAAATSQLQDFEKEKAKAIAESAVGPAITAAHAVHTFHEVHHGAPNLDILQSVVTAEVATEAVKHALHEKDALIAEGKAKFTEVLNSAGPSPDHFELRKIEDEIAKHNDHADELNTLAQNFKRELQRPEPVDVSDQPKDVRGEFESVVNRTNQLFKEQDKEMAELQERTAAQDPAVAVGQQDVRGTMAKETIGMRDEVTRELCRPVAELNVDERNAKTLEDSAGLNKAHLQQYGMRVANDPNGEKKLENFASNLEKSQNELKQELQAERPQAIENEITTLQHQHFPEVQQQAQALQGPSGPGGGGAGGGAPQQQGPQMNM